MYALAVVSAEALGRRRRDPAKNLARLATISSSPAANSAVYDATGAVVGDGELVDAASAPPTATASSDLATVSIELSRALSLRDRGRPPPLPRGAGSGAALDSRGEHQAEAEGTPLPRQTSAGALRRREGGAFSAPAPANSGGGKAAADSTADMAAGARAGSPSSLPPPPEETGKAASAAGGGGGGGGGSGNGTAASSPASAGALYMHTLSGGSGGSGGGGAGTAGEPLLRAVVLDASRIVDIDASACRELVSVFEAYGKSKLVPKPALLLSGLPGPVRDTMERFGVTAAMPDPSAARFLTVAAAVASMYERDNESDDWDDITKDLSSYSQSLAVGPGRPAGAAHLPV